MLELMSHPEKDGKYIHVAGTNGKGTTSLIVSEVLSCAGYRVGKFTSPHIHSYSERFTIDGREIKPEILNDYLRQMEDMVMIMDKEGSGRPTEFEVLTAVAFQYFRDSNVDIAVLEVGMGGLYDSTNVIKPEVSIITSIDYDHTSFLGNTMEEIAQNKAGIIKPGVPVVVGPMDEHALKVIKDKAEVEKALLYNNSRCSITRIGSPGLGGQEIEIQFSGHQLGKASFSLLGDYQLVNLATAITALMLLKQAGYQLVNENITDVLPGLSITGRMEVVSNDPLIILDVAHNPQAARALSGSLANLLPGVPKVLVFGLLDDKDALDTVKPLGDNTRVCIVTKPVSERGENWHRIEDYWRKLFPDTKIYEEESISGAIDKAISLLRPKECLVVTGSFYVLDEARQYLTDV